MLWFYHCFLTTRLYIFVKIANKRLNIIPGKKAIIFCGYFVFVTYNLICFLKWANFYLPLHSSGGDRIMLVAVFISHRKFLRIPWSVKCNFIAIVTWLDDVFMYWPVSYNIGSRITPGSKIYHVLSDISILVHVHVHVFLLQHNFLHQNEVRDLLNSSWPSDAKWRQGSRSTLVQVMAFCLTAPSHYLTMLTFHHKGPVMFIWGQFRLRYHSHQSLKLA